MSINTYFWHYIIHYIAKTLKVYDCDIDYRRDASLCIRVWKEIIRKKMMRWKMWSNEKEIKVNLWDAAMYLKLSF